MVRLEKITAVAKTVATGQKILAALLEYSSPIDGTRIKKEDFKVRNRTITDAFTIADLQPGAKKENGPYLVLTLSGDDENAMTYWKEKHVGPPPKPEEMMNLPPKKITRKALQIEVQQCGSIYSTDGEEIPGLDDWRPSESCVQLAVDDFDFHTYQDEQNGVSMMYSIFSPKQASQEPLPLVIFIGDGNTVSDDPDWSLVNCDGGVVWASPEAQAVQPCYVLVPQISKDTGSLVDDDYQCVKELDTVEHLIDYVVDSYPIDKNRIYCTGQSMGCMSFCELNCRRPGFFAASLLVAGHWDAKRMAENCGNCNLWIVVADGDDKAFDGMNAITAALEEKGAPVIRGDWDAQWDQETYTKEVEKMAQGGPGIRYCVFSRDSVFPPDYQGDRYGGFHFATWRKVYHIDALRDWLLNQRKEAEQ